MEAVFGVSLRRDGYPVCPDAPTSEQGDQVGRGQYHVSLFVRLLSGQDRADWRPGTAGYYDLYGVILRLAVGVERRG